jgi:four helix bundle protein
MASKGYQDLLVWQRALGLSETTYRVTARLPDHERYGLSSQMRRAAVAIPANIAEGQGRNTCRAFLNHLSIARGSLHELETHVILASNLQYIANSEKQLLLTQTGEVGRLLNGLMNALRQTRDRQQLTTETPDI